MYVHKAHLVLSIKAKQATEWYCMSLANRNYSMLAWANTFKILLRII